jgi:hypothetical protein
MSVEAIATVLHHSRASKTAKLVLVGIANHEGDGGAYPSIATLAKYGGCSERQVQRYIAALVELGELHVRPQAGGHDGYRSDRRPNLYRTLVRCPEWCDGSTSHRRRGDTGVAPQPNGVTVSTSRGDTGDANGVTPTSPKPSLEPSKESITRSKAKRPITDDWQPTEENLQRLQDRYPKLSVHGEIERFRDYWLSKGDARADWQAGFRQWCGRADTYRRQAAGVTEDGYR